MHYLFIGHTVKGWRQIDYHRTVMGSVTIEDTRFAERYLSIGAARLRIFVQEGIEDKDALNMLLNPYSQGVEV